MYYIFLLTWFLIIIIICNSVKPVNINAYLNISRSKAFICAMIFTLLNYWYTSMFPVKMLVGDRGNYYYDFVYGRSETIGLDYYFLIVKGITENFDFVLYLTTFLTCYIIFVVIGKFKEANLTAITFIMASCLIYSSFINQKQIFSVVFFLLALERVLNKKNKKDIVISVMLCLISALFHPSGYLCLILILLILYQNKVNYYVFIFVLIGAVIFLQPFSLKIAFLTSSVIPSFSNKIQEYFSEGGLSNANSGSVNFIKGFPYYVVMLYGLVLKKDIAFKHKNYNAFLIISIIAAVAYASCLVSYWFSRFETYFVVPVGIFCGLLVSNDKNIKRANMIKYTTIGSMAVVQIREMLLLYLNYLRFGL